LWRSVIAAVLERARQLQVDWILVGDQTNGDLHQLLFVFPERQTATTRRIPDCEAIHREMVKSGVTLSLLWNEYSERCRQAKDISLMYTQYCNYYRKYATVSKATMHLDRKTGEQMEVDCAGQTAYLVDRDTGELVTAYVFVAELSQSQYIFV
jgi:transposase